MNTQIASSKNVLTDTLSEPLGGATTAKFDIHVGDGNLIIDRLTGGEDLLASGTLQYFEKQGVPTRNLVSSDGQATTHAKGGHLQAALAPSSWSACNGATEWQVHLNPTVSSGITALSNGGNVRLDLAGMAVTRLSAETGGGNMDVVLPEGAADLHVTAKTGGGNVTVEIGSGTTGNNIINAASGAGNVIVRIRGLAARIYATTGWGKAIIDPRFSKTGPNTYQSPDFNGADNQLEINAQSGAGNVIVNIK